MDHNNWKFEFEEKQAKRKAMIRVIIALIMSAIVFYMIAMLFTSEVPQGNREVIYLLVGNATGAFFGTLISFYFGDSEGRLDTSREEKKNEEHKE